MDLQEIGRLLLEGHKQTTPLEFIAVTAGIISVWLSRQENILVFPVGLINTIIFIYISLKAHLFGEASVNVYYTIMSIYGWVLWSKRNRNDQPVVRVKFSSAKMWLYQLLFFAAFYVAIYFALLFLQKAFSSETIAWADAFASATAYTGMWLMARKKVESWYWWIATNIASIPLYFVKGYVFTSFQFLVLLVLAFSGLFAWRKKAVNGTA